MLNETESATKVGAHEANILKLFERCNKTQIQTGGSLLQTANAFGAFADSMTPARMRSLPAPPTHFLGTLGCKLADHSGAAFGILGRFWHFCTHAQSVIGPLSDRR